MKVTPIADEMRAAIDDRQAMKDENALDSR